MSPAWSGKTSGPNILWPSSRWRV